MRIDEIELENFKGFESVTFSFPSQFTVVIGNNASGKTSILDAIAVAAGSFFLGIDGAESRNIQRDEIRIKWVEGDPRPQLPVLVSAKGSISDKKNITWRRRITSDQGRTTRKGSEAIANFAKEMHQKYRSGSEEVIFPVIAYHGTGRLWAEHQEKFDYKKSTEHVLSGYKDCLSPKSSSKAFLTWYKTFYQDATNFDNKKDKTLLNTFNETITNLIPEWYDMKYHYGLDQLIGFYRGEEGEERQQSFNNLSDGYRNMIGMAADVVYRCLKLNSHLGANAVKETPGIVLIDELDLHLHPKWQRKIVEKLKQTFPKIQFICTTHSPFIVQSLNAEELINLDGRVLAADPFRRSLEENALYMGAETERGERFQEKVNDAKRFDEILHKAVEAESRSALSKNDLQTLNDILLKNSDDPALVARLQIKKLSKLGLDETSK